MAWVGVLAQLADEHNEMQGIRHYTAITRYFRIFQSGEIADSSSLNALGCWLKTAQPSAKNFNRKSMRISTAFQNNTGTE